MRTKATRVSAENTARHADELDISKENPEC